ncbi:MAG TPA: hypothetical protein VK324_01565 [Tepidisphaeraceae bacterium]|nr:hypothetical protein [Tepidisphaeraceae bacterium]
MRYRVIGSNRDTGARMQLEFEAESKAAAERKAALQGMSVARVEDVTDGVASTAHVDYATSHGRPSRGGGLTRLILWAVVLAILVAAIYNWRLIRFKLGM